MTRRPIPSLPITAFFALLFILDWVLYFRHAGHFFQADTVFLLYNRVTSISEYLRGFIQLHPSGWYRPLAFELFESLLFPVFGLKPVGYHVVVYALFMAVTIAVYVLVLALTGKHLAAAFATLFFSFHTTNAYTTYDLSDSTELMYTFFYIASVLAYLTYIRHGAKSARTVSLSCFVASLLCKEAAVTLPGTLVVFQLILGTPSRPLGTRLRHALRSTLGHSLVLLAYLAFVVGYLQVQAMSVQRLLNPTAMSKEGGYSPVLNGSILKTADTAATWAFNIPRGPWGEWRHLGSAVLGFLKAFRVLVLALAAYLLFKPERQMVLLGAVWFVVTLLPALPLLAHFIPYYLFLPIVGVSLLVGTVLLWMYEQLRRLHPFPAVAALVTVFAGLFYACSIGIRGDIRDNPLLGASAELASTSLSDLKRLYPALEGKTIYFDDSEDSLSWDHASGGLIRMSYGRDDISTLYASLGQALPANIPKDQAIALRLQNKHLVDDTAVYRADPAPFVHLENSSAHRLMVSSNTVTSGESFDIGVSGAHDVPVRIMYVLNGGPIETFTIGLDAVGHSRFEVSAATRKGVYRFLRFNISGQDEWIRSNVTIDVR